MEQSVGDGTGNDITGAPPHNINHTTQQQPHTEESTSAPSMHAAIARPRNEKAWHFFENVLKSPRLIVAPMVDASELPFRMMTRKYGADMCYTPMFHSASFAKSDLYRKRNFTTCPTDRPLVVQFCANNPDTLLAAAQHVEAEADAVDINFGCPQGIAKRGNYGAFLLDKWDLMESLVSILHENLKIPVFCKIRVLDDLDATVVLAKRLEAAGCQLLTVHGRTKEQKGRYAPPANWDIIKRIKNELSIPVFANGSVASYADIKRCMEYTQADGVMVAYPLLLNPAFFSPDLRDPFDMAREYLKFVQEYPVVGKMSRGHLHKIVKDPLNKYADLREQLTMAKDARTVEGMLKLVAQLEQRTKDNVPQVKAEDLHHSKKPKKSAAANEDTSGLDGGFTMFGSLDDDNDNNNDNNDNDTDQGDEVCACMSSAAWTSHAEQPIEDEDEDEDEKESEEKEKHAQ
eukprot:TRINITY_DN1332_c1_g1_i1.p1 TRINITY_DN1332_c1_g1~~TRINITY_DN1332_c1_g1_i1.p1  ORF type:complete len:459 (-),score=108.65 TRINITY_DN1332_c1_g1_i1:124-1500(-)